MADLDLESINYMWNEVFTWSKETLKKFGKPYGKLKDIADAKNFNRLNKPEIVDVCGRSFEYTNYLMETVEAYKNVLTRLQGQLIEKQEQIISVQAELSACKTEQLEAMKKTVSSSVADSVKAEFQSYSSVVQSLPAQSPVISPEALTSVVKTIVAEEDRGRNLLIFGLPEEKEEKLESQVSEVLETIGIKPKVEAQRIGKKKTVDSTRPVKVITSNSLIVDQILRNARNLRQSEKFKTVFLSPDRSVEQRKLRKDLVQDMKKRALAEPTKKFYIKDGQIYCADESNG